jgi:hypothetical protein
VQLTGDVHAKVSRSIFLISLILAADISAAEVKRKNPAADMIDVESDRLDVDKARERRFSGET